MKLIASSWCLASLIIGTYYAADLTSYITVPTYKSLIHSINEVPDRSDIHFVTNKESNTDAVISVQGFTYLYIYYILEFLIKFIKYIQLNQSAMAGLLKDLRKKLDAESDSRCLITKDCVDKVHTGSYVYTSV